MTKLPGKFLRLSRLSLIGVLFAFMSVFPIFIFIFRYRHPTNSWAWCSVTSPVAQKILGLTYVFDLSLAGNPDQVCVAISNHQAALDIITCGFVIPKRVAALAAKWLGVIPVFGQVFYLAGNILIDRKDRKSRQEGVDQLHDALINRNTSIWIFPEGTRSGGNGLGKFRPGAFKCAIKAGVPIQAFAISTYKDKIDFTKWSSGTVIVKALEPISTQGLKEDDWLELMESTRAAIKVAIAELDLRVPAI